jgi:hypothetical protein
MFLCLSSSDTKMEKAIGFSWVVIAWGKERILRYWQNLLKLWTMRVKVSEG